MRSTYLCLKVGIMILIVAPTNLLLEIVSVSFPKFIGYIMTLMTGEQIYNDSWKKSLTVDLSLTFLCLEVNVFSDTKLTVMIVDREKHPFELF